MSEVVNMKEPRLHRYLLGALAVLPLGVWVGGLALSRQWAPHWSVLLAALLIGYLSAWLALELYSTQLLRWFDTPEEFDCCDCGRRVWRVGIRRPGMSRRRCVECQQYPGWFLDQHLARAFDPLNLARPRPDYVKGTFH